MKNLTGPFLVLALGALSAWVLRLEARRTFGPSLPEGLPDRGRPSPHELSALQDSRPERQGPLRRPLARFGGSPAGAPRPAGKKVLLTGRILDPSGRRRRRERWRFLFTRPGPSGRREARLLPAGTDGEGRFVVPFPFPGNQAAPVVLRVRPLGEEGRALPGEEIRRELSPSYAEGITDLGDLYLEEPPCLASGRVVAPGGRPLPGVRVRVWIPGRLFPGGTLGGGREERTLPSWIPGPWEVRTDRAGAFRILGRTGADRIRLEAEGEGWLPGGSPFLAPGTEGVLLVLRRAGGLEGRIRLPSGLEAGRLWIQVRPASFGGGGPPPSTFPGPGGSFRFPSLPPGPVRLEVRDFWDGRLLQAVSDLEILPGRICRDPRLQPLDLAGRGGFSLLLVRGPSGRPLEEVLAWDPRGRPPRILRGPGGRILLPPSSGPGPLYVWAPGCRVRSVAHPRTGGALELPPGLPLRLEPARDLPPAPPPWRLRVSLTLLPRRGDSLQEGAAFLLGRSGLPCRSSRGGPGRGWEFRLPLAGTYRPEWSLAREGKTPGRLAPPAGTPSLPLLEVPPGGIPRGRALPLEIPRRVYLSLLKEARRIYASRHDEK